MLNRGDLIEFQEYNLDEGFIPGIYIGEISENDQAACVFLDNQRMGESGSIERIKLLCIEDTDKYQPEFNEFIKEFMPKVMSYYIDISDYDDDHDDEENPNAQED